MPGVLEQLGVHINFQFAFIFATLLWVRILGVVAVIPFLFGKPVPTVVRVGASVVLMAFCYPHLLPAAPPPIIENMGALVALYLKEALFGLTIGFAAGIVFHGFEAAGHMIDEQRGMSIARVLIPELGGMSSISGQFLFLLAIVVYFSLGGHLFFLQALYESYLTLPLFELPNVQPGLMPLMDLFARMTGHILFMAVQIAAPVIIAVLLADVILGVANRVAPQINVWELGFNVKGVLGVLMLFFTCTVLMRVFESAFARSDANVRSTIELLEGKVPAPPAGPEETPSIPDAE